MITIETSKPSKDEISRVAYALYLQRGCEQGKDVEDWISAEKELSEIFAEPVRPKAALVGHA
jgi:hypothetical protein